MWRRVRSELRQGRAVYHLMVPRQWPNGVIPWRTPILTAVVSIPAPGGLVVDFLLRLCDAVVGIYAFAAVSHWHAAPAGRPRPATELPVVSSRHD
jgi:hypothetical protein